MVSLETTLAALTLFSSCCLNVVFLEHLTKALPDSGSVLLFLQFLFIAIEGFLFNRKLGREKRHVPIRDYTVMVLLFFSSSATNNLALQFNIPMPLHMIFKSGSLVANMLLGAYLLKRSYSLQKYISVAMLTVGILICTFATSQIKESEKVEGYEMSKMTIGVMLLVASLLLSARTGIYQETVSIKYGKHPRETLFYTHALPLPLFILLSPSIMKSLQIFNESELLPVPFFTDALLSISKILLPYPITLKIPILWQYVAVNVITQYFCIRSIFYLISECTSLTVTLLLTLRKFVSLVLSVVYFENDFTLSHWVGTAFVFLGSLLYSDIVPLFGRNTVKHEANGRGGHQKQS